ncbi:MAG: hypothetical protein EB069_00240 [Actinobacteria bacterium]|nr:hypothetical protein [Actinomycetota bacterium]
MAIPASVLNTNIASLIAQRNLAGAQTQLSVSVERLSSGLRINRAKDDASGMAVASVIGSQIKTMGTAHRVVNDAISMMQTAEGALMEGAGMLQRMKELVTQGSNDSMSKDQYFFLVQEMLQLMQELGNVAGRTTFNGNNLLGTFRANSEDGIVKSIEGTPLPGAGQSGPWEFMTGPGQGDFMTIEQPAMWASYEEMVEMTGNERGYVGGTLAVGALNALYTRIAFLADTSDEGGAVLTGMGYDVFSKPESELTGPQFADRPDAPNQVVLDRAGNQTTADKLSLNELIDLSINQINAHRSYFGAFYSRLEANVRNLSSQTENLTAALSRIQDTDYGAETANLTRVQILQQAATAMLAQANAMPNVVLGLLRQQ